MQRIFAIIACLVILACSQAADEKAQLITPVSEKTTNQQQETIEWQSNGQKDAVIPVPEEVAHFQEDTTSVSPEVEEAKEAETERVMVLFDLHFGLAVASLEERIFLSDVIVRATLMSAANDELTFNAMEYLKGSGPKQFKVNATTAKRNTQWDGHEAILFLRSSSTAGAGGQSGTTTFEFTDTTEFNYETSRYVASSYKGDLADGFTIDSSNPVWAPAETQSGASGTAGAKAKYIESFKAISGAGLPTFTLDELRAKVAWVEGGEGIEGYDECIQEGLAFIRDYRDYEAYEGGPLEIHEDLLVADSGVAPGKNLRPSPSQFFTKEYLKLWLEGEHAALFRRIVVDKDDDPSNSYQLGLTVARPLPAGTYIVIPRLQREEWVACNFTHDIVGVAYKIVLKKPLGTVYEALFDPNTAGFSSGGGKLDPATFADNGKSWTVRAFKYENGKVVLQTEPFHDLSGMRLDLIKLDGTIGTTLLGNSATKDATNKTLSWTMTVSPWADGDKLMLRLSYPSVTPIPTLTATPAPTATPSPTPAPTSTPTPTPTLTPTPTAAVPCDVASGVRSLPWSVSNTALAKCSIGYTTARRIVVY